MIGRFWLFRISVSVNALALVYLVIHSEKKFDSIKNSSSLAVDSLFSNKNYKISISLESFDENGQKSTTTTPSANKSPVKLFPCDDLTPRTHFGQRGSFWVLFNYFKSSRHFRCDESLTYTTHADFTFLDNIVPLLERWQGPISIAIYAPGTDFEESVKRINYFRKCLHSSDKVTEFVSFHLFFDLAHMPKLKVHDDPSSIQVNCSENVRFNGELPTYKKIKNLTYPVNVARNVAKDMATTHYVLPSDIELFPSPNLIRDFLDMLRRKSAQLGETHGNTQSSADPDLGLREPKPKVYVISIFEVAKDMKIPRDKTELVQLLHNKTAVPFHRVICATCHRVPNETEWRNAKVTSELNVFHVAKRLKEVRSWEPIYIGTKFDPVYDERLSWEGRSDKMTQAHALCLLDYEFHILDNAFLVHRPGIKTKQTLKKNHAAVEKQNDLILNTIKPQLSELYGRNKGCV